MSQRARFSRPRRRGARTTTSRSSHPHAGANGGRFSFLFFLECDAQADVPSTEASGATCVQRLDDSRDSAIHTKCRISLRSSSWREPRYPLPRVMLVRRRPPAAHKARGADTACINVLGAEWHRMFFGGSLLDAPKSPSLPNQRNQNPWCRVTLPRAARQRISAPTMEEVSNKGRRGVVPARPNEGPGAEGEDGSVRRGVVPATRIASATGGGPDHRTATSGGRRGRGLWQPRTNARPKTASTGAEPDRAGRLATKDRQYRSSASHRRSA